MGDNISTDVKEIGCEVRAKLVWLKIGFSDEFLLFW
jgi:hypothetical protein